MSTTTTPPTSTDQENTLPIASSSGDSTTTTTTITPSSPSNTITTTPSSPVLQQEASTTTNEPKFDFEISHNKSVYNITMKSLDSQSYDSKQSPTNHHQHYNTHNNNNNILNNNNQQQQEHSEILSSLAQEQQEQQVDEIQDKSIATNGSNLISSSTNSLFGLFSSFILLYTTGDNLIVQSRSNQKLQMKSVIDYEIGEMVKSTTLIMNQLLYQIKSGGPFDLNNNITWFRIFYYLKRLYVHKSPLKMLYFGRFDQSFIGVEVDFVRVLLKASTFTNLERMGTDYHLISDPNLIYSPSNIIESKNWTLEVTNRAWYSIFTKYQTSNKTLSNVKWSPLFSSIFKYKRIYFNKWKFK
ncbi:predicted protein [Naegleria gruberi]|uniref:Predicted protein n=1 Tax=Naegleria gruberi TaxID=5762 RepID=D2W601_NAEGR|nr:uncharacterized protein NAEGRDRAFT_82368 [Naegleria gruberi]EFC35501.1 predicted protein [Naegleria gruberi]|eukprot:XP_002668245.1 predicted protein [Naegleria gruberi strain NEG-M]